MKYQDPASFRQALEQRLKNQTEGDGALLARIRESTLGKTQLDDQHTSRKLR
jgi:hypothetical protein